MKYHLTTLGCQMNEHDSEKIAGMLQTAGYQRTDDAQEADLILINTCCVRENPERKVYGRLGDLKSVKRERPGLIIGVCGCMVQESAEREKIAESYPQVDLVFGTHNLHKLPEYLQRVWRGERVIEVWEDSDELAEGLPVERESGLHAWVNITYGCDNYCSYCIVPYVRGHCRSRQPESIVEEISQLAAQGVKEVTLLGQNVNSYGLDLEREVDFADLLVAVNSVDGLERIRFTTSHPKDVSDKLVKVLATVPKVCEHLHLPLQAGSTKVLKAMNRGYTADEYLDLVRRIREAIPEISLTTDLIVGFPGETDEDFEETLRVVREVGFDGAFTFVYSKRKGTPAAALEEQVPDEVKKDRIYRLIEMQQSISRERNERMRGAVVEVLVEGPSKTNPEMLSGRTRTNKLVHFAGDEKLVGELVQVRIEDISTWTLHGVLV